jgi:hypothetical protein
LLQVKRNISKIRLNVTDDLWGLFQGSDVLIEDAWTLKVRERLKSFEQDLLRSMKSDGWDGTEEESVVQWSFAGALFYSIIVITTIGKQQILKVSFSTVVPPYPLIQLSTVYRRPQKKKIKSFFNPVAPHVPYGLRGLPSRLWPNCNRLLRLGRPSGAVTLS